MPETLQTTPVFSQTTAVKQESSKRIPSLDGLRALSIWAVLLGHASSQFTSGPLHTPLFRFLFSILSYMGVTVFFVISGFLITTLLLREQARTSRINLAGFYRRRAVRILPASLFYVAVILLLAHPSFTQAVYALTFTTSYFFDQAYKGLQHLWSLSVEEQFYFLWPLVFVTGIKNAKRYCWLIMLAAPVIRIVLKHNGLHVYAHAAPAIADSLSAGCLLAFYQDQVRALVRRYFLSTRSFFLLGLFTVTVSGFLLRADYVLLWGIMFALIAITTCAAIERKDPILNWTPLVWTGLLSYSLYLWQQPMLVFNGPLHYLAVRLPLIFVLAYLSYRFVEQPMLRFRGSKPAASLVPPAVVEKA